MDYTITAGAPALAYPPAPGAAPVGATPPGRPPAPAPANGTAPFGKLIRVLHYWPDLTLAPLCRPVGNSVCLSTALRTSFSPWRLTDMLYVTWTLICFDRHTKRKHTVFCVMF